MVRTSAGVWAVALSTFGLLLGCGSSSTNGPGGGGSGPVGPVAHDAGEAWPDVPTNVPVLSGADIVRACAEIAVCDPTVGAGATALDRVGYCIGQILWSAERAIPMSNQFVWNERAEYVVSCELAHVGDCASQKQCYSSRDGNIFCEEDGCKATASLSVSCNGSVAHIKKGNGSSFDRDCSHAYADCDTTSPTGCTDRHFSACPENGNKADHCDGNVRLGCDGAGQVSYRDCARMGGTCGAIAGGQGCIYTTPADPKCPSAFPAAACESGMLAACVNGKRVSVTAPSVCP